jgi:glycosyltransferase involved in cell wall biosynthesis
MQAASPQFSVVIPVYNSARIVGQVVIEQTAAFFRQHDLRYEIILVNDASRDQSWS